MNTPDVKLQTSSYHHKCLCMASQLKFICDAFSNKKVSWFSETREAVGGLFLLIFKRESNILMFWSRSIGDILPSWAQVCCCFASADISSPPRSSTLQFPWRLFPTWLSPTVHRHARLTAGHMRVCELVVSLLFPCFLPTGKQKNQCLIK